MTDKDHRPLIAIARAKLTMGLLLFMTATVLLAWGMVSTAQEKSKAPIFICGNSVEHRFPTALANDAERIAFQRGERLFKANCASCHKPDRNMTGPALKGARERWALSGGDIHAWVKNSLGYLKSHPRDAYAQDLFKKFNGSIMTPNAVSDEDVDAILSYADNYVQVVRPGIP